MSDWAELLNLARAQILALRARRPRVKGRLFLKEAQRRTKYPWFWPLRLDLVLEHAEERLIVYGTLVPGGQYHHLLSDLEPAIWEPCRIRGRLGRFRGYPAFKWIPAGEAHPAWLVTSPGLPARYELLDRFEGQAYTRRLIPAEAGARLVIANIYEARVRV